MEKMFGKDWTVRIAGIRGIRASRSVTIEICPASWYQGATASNVDRSFWLASTTPRTTHHSDPAMNKMFFDHWNQRFLAVITTVALFAVAGCGKDSSNANVPLDTTSAETSSQELAVTDPTPTTTDSGDPQEPTADDVDRSDQVLRHAVFFTFKDDSSEQDVQAVVDAFAALPSKIDTIANFQWGTNNSPEDHDDGFTHCFLLSFATAADRDAYIPHPAHSGEFAGVLRPHLKDVFVFDYWGTPPAEKIEKQLKHAVFFKFKDDAAAEDVKKIEQAFAALPAKIDSIKAFEWGTNNSPENKADGFTHCFMVTFDSEEGREAYLPHPDHLAFVEVLMPVLDKVRVLDFWVQ